MNRPTNPILMEMSKQLPDTVQTFKHIQEGKSYEDIVIQAKKEMFCLRNREGQMENGQSTQSVLEESGYRFLLENSDEEDENEERLRLMGTLQLIAELSEDLAED